MGPLALAAVSWPLLGLVRGFNRQILGECVSIAGRSIRSEQGTFDEYMLIMEMQSELFSAFSMPFLSFPSVMALPKHLVEMLPIGSSSYKQANST